MKIKNLFSVLTMAALILSSCSGNDEVKKDDNTERLAPGEIGTEIYQGVALPLEAQLYLPIHEVDSLEGLGLIDSVRYFAKTNNTELNKLVAEIDTSDFNFLLNEVVTHTNDCNGKPYITALRMTLGLRNDSIIPVYQALLLCNSNQQTNGGIVQGTFDITYEGNAYVHYGNGFVDAQDTTGLYYGYRNDMRLKDTLNGVNFHNWIRDLDTRSLVFPFQVIKALSYDNMNASSLKIWNSIRKFPSGNYTLVYHSLLLSSSTMPGSLTFTNKFANLAHLCPPYCGSLVYRMK
jgi:hypothetical protein